MKKYVFLILLVAMIAIWHYFFPQIDLRHHDDNAVPEQVEEADETPALPDSVLTAKEV